MNRFTLIFFLIAQISFAQNIENYRSNFLKAVNNKTICDEMIQELKTYQKETIYKAYLGAYETIWANHAWNPISKLNSFNQGKAKIEQAISKAPNNIEIKLLRYSIQKNAPKFLNYSSNIEADRNFILKHQNSVKEESLQKLIKLVN